MKTTTQALTLAAGLPTLTPRLQKPLGFLKEAKKEMARRTQEATHSDCQGANTRFMINGPAGKKRYEGNGKCTDALCSCYNTDVMMPEFVAYSLPGKTVKDPPQRKNYNLDGKCKPGLDKRSGINCYDRPSKFRIDPGLCKECRDNDPHKCDSCKLQSSPEAEAYSGAFCPARKPLVAGGFGGESGGLAETGTQDFLGNIGDYCLHYSNFEGRKCLRASNYQDYDLGHMAPSKSTWTFTNVAEDCKRADGSDLDTPRRKYRYQSCAWLSSFMMTNIVPQASTLNQGCWRYLENSILQIALEKRRDLSVVVGVDMRYFSIRDGVFGEKNKGAVEGLGGLIAELGSSRSGSKGVDRAAVPNYMYMAAVDEESGESLAFYVENRNLDYPTGCRTPHTLDELALRLGTDHVPGFERKRSNKLMDDIEDQLPNTDKYKGSGTQPYKYGWAEIYKKALKATQENNFHSKMDLVKFESEITNQPNINSADVCWQGTINRWGTEMNCEDYCSCCDTKHNEMQNCNKDKSLCAVGTGSFSTTFNPSSAPSWGERDASDLQKPPEVTANPTRFIAGVEAPTPTPPVVPPPVVVAPTTPVHPTAPTTPPTTGSHSGKFYNLNCDPVRGCQVSWLLSPANNQLSGPLGSLISAIVPIAAQLTRSAATIAGDRRMLQESQHSDCIGQNTRFIINGPASKKKYEGSGKCTDALCSCYNTHSMMPEFVAYRLPGKSVPEPPQYHNHDPQTGRCKDWDNKRNGIYCYERPSAEKQGLLNDFKIDPSLCEECGAAFGAGDDTDDTQKCDKCQLVASPVAQAFSGRNCLKPGTSGGFEGISFTGNVGDYCNKYSHFEGRQCQREQSKYQDYDLGHMAPSKGTWTFTNVAEDCKRVDGSDLDGEGKVPYDYSSCAFLSSYMMTNIVPQASTLNRGCWRELENFFGKLAVIKKRDLSIIVGVDTRFFSIRDGVYIPGETRFDGTTIRGERVVDGLGNNVVELGNTTYGSKGMDRAGVPDYLYMAALDEDTGDSLAFYVENRNIEFPTGCRTPHTLDELALRLGTNHVPGFEGKTSSTLMRDIEDVLPTGVNSFGTQALASEDYGWREIYQKALNNEGNFGAKTDLVQFEKLASKDSQERVRNTFDVCWDAKKPILWKGRELNCEDFCMCCETPHSEAQNCNGDGSLCAISADAFAGKEEIVTWGETEEFTPRESGTEAPSRSVPGVVVTSPVSGSGTTGDNTGGEAGIENPGGAVVVGPPGGGSGSPGAISPFGNGGAFINLNCDQSAGCTGSWFLEGSDNNDITGPLGSLLAAILPIAARIS